MREEGDTSFSFALIQISGDFFSFTKDRLMDRGYNVNILLDQNTLTLKRKSISPRLGSGQVLVGLLEFKQLF
jgi:hypothetical protein